MRRVLIILVVFLGVSLTSLAILVNGRASEAGELPPPDPLLPIAMADGSSLPLFEVLDHLRNDVPLPGAPSVTPEPRGLVEFPRTGGRTAPVAIATAGLGRLDTYTNWWGPTFALARQQEDLGNYDQAIALYQSVGEDEPSYAYARRRIGWHILAQAKGQPARGVPFVQEAMRHEPLEGNSWHDLARVYGATLGIDVD